MTRWLQIFAKDDTIDLETKAINEENVLKIAEYCANKLDCRRVTALKYFDEHYTREKCLKGQKTTCDNCLRESKQNEAKFMVENVTDICPKIIQAVEEICGGANRLTLLHIFS